MTHITDKSIEQNSDTVVTLGNFDGLHRGHQKLINTAKADGRNTVVFSFFPHPVSLFKNVVFQTILSSAEKALLLEGMGVDTFIEYPFDAQVAAMDAERFVRDVLVEKLRCKRLVVGQGYRFGRGGKGDCGLLGRLGERYGFTLEVVPHVMMGGGEKISSTYVREAILNRRFDKARELMGKPYFVAGEVVHGSKLGRDIGAPTANMRPPEYKLLPPAGVYETRVRHGGRCYLGLTNVGTRPTVGDCADKLVETYIFDFAGDLYGQSPVVEFCGWVRDEVRFNSIEELRGQILRDMAAVSGRVD